MPLPRPSAAALTLITATFALATGLVQAQASTPGWRIVNTIGPAKGSTGVADLVASGPGNAWSTWSSCGPCGVNEVDRTFFLHWDGAAWRRVTVPSVFAARNVPAAFAARSSTDAWAFGWDASNHPVSARWNGTAWTVRPLPSWVLRINGAGDATITAAVFRATDVWVFSRDALTLPTVAAHFNGTRWRKVTLPGIPVSVSALSRRDIWAVGVAPKSGGGSPSFVAMHWNGTSWQTVKVPKVSVPPGSSRAVFNAVAMGPRSVWMASGISANGNPPKVSLLHWNGTRWRTVKLSFPTSVFNEMAQDGHGGLWLVTNGPAPGFAWFFDHYNGGRWSRTPIPTTTGSHTQVTRVTWIPGTRSVWAAGELVEKSGLVGVTLKFGP